MPKGKTNQPLVFAIPAEWEGHPGLQELWDKGHTYVVHEFNDGVADVIIGPQCHMMNDTMLKQKGIMTALMAAARKRKRGTK